MTLQDQIARDFLAFDGLETGTYISKLSTGDVTIPNVLLFPAQIQRRDLAFIGNLATQVRTTVWHIRASEFVASGTVPKQGDQITDASGLKWKVLSTQFQSLRQRHRFVCVEDR